MLKHRLGLLALTLFLAVAPPSHRLAAASAAQHDWDCPYEEQRRGLPRPAMRRCPSRSKAIPPRDRCSTADGAAVVPALGGDVLERLGDQLAAVVDAVKRDEAAHARALGGAEQGLVERLEPAAQDFRTDGACRPRRPGSGCPRLMRPAGSLASSSSRSRSASASDLRSARGACSVGATKSRA